MIEIDDEKGLIEPEVLTSAVGQRDPNIEMQVATAKRYPRSVKRFLEHAEQLACIDEEVAGTCYYSLPRAEKSIEGPSIRLAELAAHCWTNLRAISQMGEITDQHVTARAVVWDMETNVAVGVETRRRITDKNGNRYNDDMINMTISAAGAIVFRNGVFRIIPRTYIDQLWMKAKRIAAGEAKGFEDRLKKLLVWFSKIQVTPEMLAALLGHTSPEQFTLEDLGTLRGVITALSEGHITKKQLFQEIENGVFEANDGRTATERLTDLMQQKKKASTPTKKESEVLQPTPEPTTRWEQFMASALLLDPRLTKQLWEDLLRMSADSWGDEQYLTCESVLVKLRSGSTTVEKLIARADKNRQGA